MKVVNTGDSIQKPSIVMMVYGEGGVGKTTFTSTAPKPLLADCEGGAKYFGLRGIKMDVALIEKWSDMEEFLLLAKTEKYETVIIDPIGELMDKLKRFMIAKNDRKLVQQDGSPTMTGWGWLKTTMRMYLKALRDAGKHVIIIAHVSEGKDEERLVKRPMIETKLSEELVNMVDIVGYMTIVKAEDGEDKRVIIVDPTSDKYTAKDRTGQLGKYIEPDFTKIVNACQGTETYSWSKQKETPKPPETPKAETPKTTPPQTPKNDEDFTEEELVSLASQLGGTVEKPPTLSNPHLAAAKAKLELQKSK